ncbi:uncharacterized protein LOC131893006 isoform X1 [Tigriopus californicus]|uniref:uncharacterized protein LOC131893006 isoform X1 n=1 Tax=Tigriopus californicus TaxID=6832 RepID=UPI0027DA569D|nr:uncharacterized protein LOC131893006 isoform X1 [Tigriopus californicus]
MILVTRQLCGAVNLFIVLGHVLGYSEDFEERSGTTPSLDDCLCFNNSISSASSSSSTTLIVSINTLVTNTSSSSPSTAMLTTTTGSSTSTLASTTAPAVSTTGTSTPSRPCISFGESAVPLECPPDGQVGLIVHNITFDPDGAGPCSFMLESPRFSIPAKTYPNAKGPEGYQCIFKFTSTDTSRKILMNLKQDDFDLPGDRPSCVDDKLVLPEVRDGGFTMCGTFNRDRNFTSQGDTITAQFFVNQNNEGTRGDGFKFTVTSIPGS